MYLIRTDEIMAKEISSEKEPLHLSYRDRATEAQETGGVILCENWKFTDIMPGFFVLFSDLTTIYCG